VAELLTRRQLEIVQVYVRAGGLKPAAVELQLSRRTVEKTLARARNRAKVDTTPQLVQELSRRGEL
jgi:DNA-binding CsgD family transcriptional regulator